MRDSIGLKIKNLFLVLICALTLFGFGSSFSLLAGAYSSSFLSVSTPNEPNCIPQIRALVDKITIPTQQVISVAEASPAFTALKGSNSASLSAINTLTYNTLSCSVTFEGLEVDFNVVNASGKAINQIVVDEDASMASVTQVYENQARTFSFTPIGDAWEVYSNPGATHLTLYSSLQFFQPTPSVPSGFACYYACEVAFGAGVTNNPLGSSGNLAQAGDVAEIACISQGNCGTNYYGWWEPYPNTAANTCNPTGGLPSGDSVYFEAENEQFYGGSSSKCDFYVQDVTSGHTCSKIGYSWSSFTSRYYSQSALECITSSGSCSTTNVLAAFPNLSVSADTGNTSGLYSINYPYSNGYYNHDDPMDACSYSHTNVASNAPSYGFTWTYYDSTCT